MTSHQQRGVVTSKKPRLRSGFTLGGEQAEADPLLDEAFLETGFYRVLESPQDPRCFLIGRTGAGKSAALQHLEKVNSEHVVRITPEDLSLPYITDLQVFRFLDSLDVNLDLLWIALWKHVLLVEIIKKRYLVNSAAAKQRFMAQLKEKLARDQGKRAALDYLEEFEGRFWCEADQRVRDITESFTSKIEAEARASGSVGVATGTLGAKLSEQQDEVTRTELADRFQRIVNSTQLARLNKMMSVLDEDILDEQHFTYVVIDDLDRDWVDERLANDLIRCLFRSVLDMGRVENLKMLVALRTNIFEELDFGKRSGGQEEKFRSLVLQVRWTSGDLIQLLDDRVRAAADQEELPHKSMLEFLPQPNRSRGNPVDYMLDRTLLRPRDAIAFANECLALGVGRTRLSWKEVFAAERTYSHKRLLALRDEWKLTYPGIQQLFEVFRGVPSRMDQDTFQARLEDAMMLLAEPDFDGVRWLTDLSASMWSPGAGDEWFDLYQPLARFFYRIGLIGCSMRGRAKPVFFADDELLLDAKSTVDRLEYFFVHRMYREALDVQADVPAPFR
jgi:hypothetical protein